MLMPTFNVAPWVEEAVKSVLTQTYSDFELLVMDDCSSDDTVTIVRKIQDPRVRVVKNEYNLGLSENLNKGLSLISTDYVARFDGDDIAEPTWLEKEVAVLDSHPEIGICSAGFHRFGTSDSLVRFPEYHDDIVANMLFSCSVIVPTFRYSLYSEMGLRYRADAFPAEDYRFWAECLRKTKIYNIQETLFHYRMHPTQICSSKQEAQKVKVDEVRRYMLEWLDSEMDEMDIRYYLERFVPGVVDSKSDLKELRCFAKKLMQKNDQLEHFSKKSLGCRFRSHIVQSFYAAIVNRFFSGGYSLKIYCRYLFSGLAFHTTWRYEAKFLMKSLLHRNK